MEAVERENMWGVGGDPLFGQNPQGRARVDTESRARRQNFRTF